MQPRDVAVARLRDADVLRERVAQRHVVDVARRLDAVDLTRAQPLGQGLERRAERGGAFAQVVQDGRRGQQLAVALGADDDDGVVGQLQRLHGDAEFDERVVEVGDALDEVLERLARDGGDGEGAEPHVLDVEIDLAGPQAVADLAVRREVAALERGVEEHAPRLVAVVAHDVDGDGAHGAVRVLQAVLHEGGQLALGELEAERCVVLDCVELRPGGGERCGVRRVDRPRGVGERGGELVAVPAAVADRAQRRDGEHREQSAGRARRHEGRADRGPREHDKGEDRQNLARGEEQQPRDRDGRQGANEYRSDAHDGPPLPRRPRAVRVVERRPVGYGDDGPTVRACRGARASMRGRPAGMPVRTGLLP